MTTVRGRKEGTAAAAGADGLVADVRSGLHLAGQRRRAVASSAAQNRRICNGVSHGAAAT